MEKGVKRRRGLAYIPGESDRRRREGGREVGVISEAALSAYSFIIQSNVCLSPVALALFSSRHAVHLLNPFQPPPSEIRQNLNLSSIAASFQ